MERSGGAVLGLRRSRAVHAASCACRFPSQHFYRGVLQSSDSVLRRVVPRGSVWLVGGLPLAFWTLTEEEKARDRILRHAQEAEIVVDVVSEFLRKRRGPLWSSVRAAKQVG